MAATTYGTAHLYGVSLTVLNATVLDFKIDEECANTDNTLDETGKVIERRYDDKTKTGSITLRIRTAYTIPTPGESVVFETVTYEITKVGRTQQQKGFRTVELSIMRSEGITYV